MTLHPNASHLQAGKHGDSRLFSNRKHKDGLPNDGCNLRNPLDTQKVEIPHKLGFGSQREYGGLSVREIQVVDLDDGAFGWYLGRDGKVFGVSFAPPIFEMNRVYEPVMKKGNRPKLVPAVNHTLRSNNRLPASQIRQIPNGKTIAKDTSNTAPC
jgi:hypothetical protein